MNDNRTTKTILLVEDEAIIAMAEARKVQGFGYEVIIVHSGKEAVELAMGKTVFDLILMDIDLGKEIDGPQTAQQILAKRNIPIVFLTSHSEKEYVDRVKEITRYGYVIKNSGDFVLQSSIEMAFELFEAHRKISESEVRQRTLVHTIPDLIWLKDPDGVYLACNPMFEQFFGAREVDIVGKTDYDFQVKEVADFFREHDLKAMAAGKPSINEEWITFASNGRRALLETIKTPMLSEDGRLIGVLGIGRDITERKRVEEELILKSLVLDQIQDHVTITDLNGKIIYINQAQVDILETSRMKLVGQSTEIFGEDAVRGPTQHEILEKTLRDGAWKGEVVNYAADGSKHMMDLRTQVVHDASGTAIAVCGSATDITERKQAEDVLKKSEKAYRTMFENTGTSVILIEDDLTISMANREFVRNTGYSVEEIIGRIKWIELVHPDDRDRMAEQHRLRREAPESALPAYEFRYITKTGDIRDTLLTVQLVPGTRTSIASLVDITDRKRAEKTLEETEKLYQFITDNSVDVISRHSADGAFLFVSPSCEKLTGFTVPEIIGKPGEFLVHPEDYGLVVEAIRSRLEKEDHYQVEHRLPRKDGSIIWVQTMGRFVRDESGQLKEILCNVRDITERKRAELQMETIVKALRESEERLRVTLDVTRIAIWDWNIANDIWYTSSRYYTMLGYEPESGPADRAIWLERVHPQDREPTANKIRCVLDGQDDHYEYEARMMHADGSYRWHHVLGHVVDRDEYGKAIRMLGVRIDITEHKKAEESLLRSERQLHMVTDTIPAHIAYVNSEEMRYRFVNRVFAEAFGMSPEHMVGKHVNEVLGEKAYLRALPYIERAKSGERIVYENCIPILGELRWFKIDYQPEFDEQGIVRNIIVLATDITERRQAEERINNLLKEKELLLKEIHHRVKNNMATLMSMLSLQSNMLRDPFAVAALEDARNRMQSMEVLYDKLYRSENLWEMSVKEYLPSLVDGIIGNFHNSAIVKIEKHIEDFVLGVRVLSPLGIIINELLTNAMKYAFTGRKNGLISISASIKDNLVTIVIGDDGIGIPESVEMGGSTGFGLMLVGILTKQINGSIKIERKNGTRFALEFKV